MKQKTLLPPNQASKSRRRQRWHDDAWSFLQPRRRETNPVSPESERRQVSLQPDEEMGCEYWLG